MKLVLVLLLLCFSLALNADEATERHAIESRIKPVGLVSVANQNNPEQKKTVPVAVEQPGKNIYDQYCSVCHRDGLAGAPKFRNQQDWKPRLTGKTIDDLVPSMQQGLNAMPMKGSCMQCSDEDLKNALTYMLPKL